MASCPNHQNESTTTKTIQWKALKKESETWKSLIDDLKRYGEFKSVIKIQQIKKEMIKKEIDELGYKKTRDFYTMSRWNFFIK